MRSSGVVAHGAGIEPGEAGAVIGQKRDIACGDAVQRDRTIALCPGHSRRQPVDDDANETVVVPGRPRLLG